MLGSSSPLLCLFAPACSRVDRLSESVASRLRDPKRRRTSSAVSGFATGLAQFGAILRHYKYRPG